MGIGPTELIIILAFAALIIAPLWMILTKAGYDGRLSLVILVPGIGPLLAIALMIYLAFSTWPIEQKLAELQTETGSSQHV